MTATYQIVLESPMGERWGTLSLIEEGPQLRGTLSLLGFDNPVRGTREGDAVRLLHHMRTAVSDLDCVTELRQAAGTLTGITQTGRARMKFYGTAVPPERRPGTEEGAHDID